MTAGGNGRLTIFQAAAVDDQRLGNAAFRVLAALGSYADSDGFCYPSQATIAKRLKVTRQAVAKCIAQLEALDYIAVTHQFGPNGAKRNSLYRLNFSIVAPTQPGVASPMQPEVTETQPEVVTMQPQKLHPTQPDVATHATSEVAYNVPLNDPKLTTQKNDPERVRAVRVTLDTYTPSEKMREWAAENVPGIPLAPTVENWRDHHRAKGDAIKDFDASLRTWLRRERPQGGTIHAINQGRSGQNGRQAGYGDRRLKVGTAGSHGPGGHDSWADEH